MNGEAICIMFGTPIAVGQRGSWTPALRVGRHEILFDGIPPEPTKARATALAAEIRTQGEERLIVALKSQIHPEAPPG